VLLILQAGFSRRQRGLKPRTINASLDAALKRRSTYTSKITGMISGRREVFLTMKRFRSWRIFSLIMP